MFHIYRSATSKLLSLKLLCVHGTIRVLSDDAFLVVLHKHKVSFVIVTLNWTILLPQWNLHYLKAFEGQVYAGLIAHKVLVPVCTCVEIHMAHLQGVLCDMICVLGCRRRDCRCWFSCWNSARSSIMTWTWSVLIDCGQSIIVWLFLTCQNTTKTLQGRINAC